MMPGSQTARDKLGGQREEPRPTAKVPKCVLVEKDVDFEDN